MKPYDAMDIRNIVIGGHSGSGKTSLAEALLYKAGASDRLGKVSDGNTVRNARFFPVMIYHKGV